jgi:putative ABC transport system substrate-binding protein
LRDLNYVEGQNLVIEYRWAEGRYDRFPAFVAEAIRLNVDVIVTAGTPAAVAAKEATKTVPIVMAVISDPVDAGIVQSLARPGGNITGSATMQRDITFKRLELTKELLPSVSRIAVLWNRANPNHRASLKQLETVAQTLRFSPKPQVSATNRDELEQGFRTIAASHAEALLVLADRALLTHRTRIVDFSAKQRLPAVYPYREFVEAGGLASYTTNFPAMFRRAATYVDKIVKGANPGDLPVEQPTTFELIINLKTAKALGLTIPQSVLLRADQVIQ